MPTCWEQLENVQNSKQLGLENIQIRRIILISKNNMLGTEPCPNWLHSRPTALHSWYKACPSSSGKPHCSWAVSTWDSVISAWTLTSRLGDCNALWSAFIRVASSAHGGYWYDRMKTWHSNSMRRHESMHTNLRSFISNCLHFCFAPSSDISRGDFRGPEAAVGLVKSPGSE